MKRSYIREILDNINEETISFAGGLPNEDLFANEDIKKACNIVLDDKKSLQYSSSLGILSLREKIASLYTNKYDFKTTSDEVLITTGSQQSFDLIGKMFLKNEVTLDRSSYIGAIGAFKILNIKMNEFKDVSDIKNKLKKKSALYCMSEFSNPTSLSYSKDEKNEILDTLKQKDAFLLEDAAYSLLSFDGKISKPISASYDKSFHLGSFSKIIAPGLRVGFIRAKKEYIDKLLIAKEALDLHTSTLIQMILSKYLEDNDIFTHLHKIRNDYEKRMEFMASCFKKYIPSFSFTKAKGGMFIYGSFKQDSYVLAKKALEHNIVFVPASVFSASNKNSNFARFNFSNSSYEKIEKGIKILGEIIKESEEENKKSIWFYLFKNNIKNS